MDQVPDDLTNGNADFSEATYEGTAQFIKKRTAYMNVFMHVIREYEAAPDHCNAAAFDKAVSLLGKRGAAHAVPVRLPPRPPPRNPLMPEAVAPKRGDIGSLCHPVLCCAIFLWC